MAEFIFTSPEGKKFRIKGPDGATKEQALQQFLSMRGEGGGRGGYQQPEPPPGVIIHGGDGRSTVAGTDLSAARPESGDERATAAAMEALKQRAAGRDMGAFGRGLMPLGQGVSLNAMDETVSAIQGGINAVQGGSYSDGYNVAQEVQKQELERERTENPVRSTLGEAAGGLSSGLGVYSAGGTALRMVPQAWTGAKKLSAVAGATGADGLAYGAVSGFNRGEGFTDRAGKAAGDGAMGSVIGGALPLVGAAARVAGAPVINPIMSRLNPEGYASAKLLEGYRRAGETGQGVSRTLGDAASDGQGVFTVADALGNSGQRMLSGVARIPQGERQALVEALERRQGDQGRRLTTFLKEGFDAPQTAKQTEKRLLATRSANAATNYGAARSSAGAVDVSPAIKAADDILAPGAGSVMSNSTGIADNSIEATVRRARRFLTDGNSQVSDFNQAFRAKQELDALIETASPTVQRQLITVRNALDDSLASASQPYAAARDAFKAESRAIDTIKTGRDAARGGRLEDNLQTFSGLRTDAERQAFRSGYVDPFIDQAQNASHGVNKARPLITTATEAEFPRFAAPGRGEQMGRRIGREQTMFETRAAATGGSKTADNLADSADTTTVDPAIIGNLISGNFLQAGKSALSRGGAEVSGMTPKVAERLSRALMETDPNGARQAVDKAFENIKLSEAKKNTLIRLLMSGSVAGLN